jgi:hypothetical protein
MRTVALFLKRNRLEKQKAQSNIELYLDDWVYQHGPIDYLPSKDHPQGGPVYQNALADCLDRVEKQQRARTKDHDGLDGPLGDFEKGEPR